MTNEVQGAEKLFSTTRRFLGKSGQRQLEKAYRFALESHKDQYRKSGESYIEHPVAVAAIIAELELDADTLSAALLHDAVEDTDLTLEDIRVEFNEQIAEIIDGVTKLDRLKFESAEERQAENMRKMLIAMARDVRVILIKLADRLHNMQTISALPPERRARIAEETLEIYGPLAHRFGISQVKWRLEDLAFEVLQPKRYHEIQKMVAERRSEREKFMDQVEMSITEQLGRHRIKAEVSGRVKHFYSIYEKMVNRGVEFDEIMDLSAVRVVVDSVKDCYAALGLIHAMWKPVPGRFKDYIAMPKLNMYQSLHTVVISLEGRPIEIQIRTREMHRTAEFGIAAHWLYKETKRRDQGGRWLKQVMDWQQELSDPTEFMKTLKIDLFQDEVFAFTPKGKLLSLPRGATPIDFAYSIHTEVGHRCVGAKVNGRMVPLAYQLQNGDIVEIMTSKTSAGPSQDWINIVETPRARNKIRQWFSRERRVDEIQEGREALERAMRKKGLPFQRKEVGRVLLQVAEDFHFSKMDDMYRQIGAGQISGGQVANKAAQYLGVGKKEVAAPEPEDDVVRQQQIAVEDAFVRQMVRVHGIENALVTVARCCGPSPGDPVVGFVTRGRGVSVHRADCPNVQGLSREADRMIEVSWGGSEPAVRVVEICVEAMDRPKLVRDITTALGDQHVNILSASFAADSQHIARCTFIFEIGSNVHLQEIVKDVRKIDSVFDAFEVIQEADSG